MPDPLVAVLAAGRASRFGGGKLDADLAGKPVGRWVLEAIRNAGLAPGVIVIGPDTPRFAEGDGWQSVVNDRPEQGLGSSLALAAGQTTGGLLVLLADMPLVMPSHIAALAAAPSATLWPGGKPGVPAHFSATDLPLLRSLTGDRGAGPFLAAMPELRLVEAPSEMLIDIDRPEDLVRAEELLRSKRPAAEGHWL